MMSCPKIQGSDLFSCDSSSATVNFSQFGGFPLRRSSPLEFTSALQVSSQILQRIQIPYSLIGAVAVGFLGKPRATLDIDFLVAVLPQDILKILRAFSGVGFHRDASWHNENPLLANRVLRVRKGATIVDFLIVMDEQERMALKRRRIHRAGKLRFYTVTAEDLLLMKLKAGRPRDWDDLLGVLTRQKGTMNWSYLRQWSRRLGLTEEMAYLQSLIKNERRLRS